MSFAFDLLRLCEPFVATPLLAITFGFWPRLLLLLLLLILDTPSALTCRNKRKRHVFLRPKCSNTTVWHPVSHSCYWVPVFWGAHFLLIVSRPFLYFFLRRRAATHTHTHTLHTYACAAPSQFRVDLMCSACVAHDKYAKKLILQEKKADIQNWLQGSQLYSVAQH